MQLLALFAALALGRAAKEKKPKKCTPFKCYGKKEMTPKSPFFAPKGDTSCPEGVNAALAPCCHARDACAGVCGATEAACAAAFKTCLAGACEAVDDVDEYEVCKKDAALGADAPWRDGCATHAAAQKRACSCEPSEKAAARRTKVLESIYQRYDADNVAKVPDLIFKADTPRLFANLIVKLAAKFPALYRDAAPKAEAKPRKPPPPPRKKPPPPPEPEAAEPEAEAPAAEDEEEDVIDLDGEL
mmetsp:Transcript_1341/g.4018  ORF Transcript_1341/g.4018 Transcript_1341/m.4018 type:complete len:244 (+) Transcript_1341:119-850(+)